MHYQPGTSDQTPVQEGSRLLAVTAAGGRGLERPENELEQTGARPVGLEPPHEYGAGMGLDMTHQTTGVGCTPFFYAQTKEQPLDAGTLNPERSTTTRGDLYK